MLGNCSDDVRRLMSKVGVASHPSTQRRASCPASGGECSLERAVSAIADRPGRIPVAVLDDFLFDSGTSPLPTVSGVCHRRCALGTTIVKDVACSAGPFRRSLGGANGEVIGNQPPLTADSAAVEEALADDDRCRSGCSYGTSRPPPSGNIFVPYPGTHVRRESGPVSLRGVIPLSLREVNMSSIAGLRSEFHQLMQRAGKCLDGERAMFVVGDWTTYRVLKCAVTAEAPAFGLLVPLPGIFQIALNLQMGVIESFGFLFSQLWRAAFPRSIAFAADRVDTMPAARRAALLRIVDEAWWTVRAHAIDMFRYALVPIEYWVLIHVFDWLVPLSLDFYGAVLDGDLATFHRLLGSAWRAFAHMKKTNYTRLTLLLLTDLRYWGQCRPDIIAVVRECLPCLGEEEIEMFHSVIRRWIHPGEEANDFVERARGVATLIHEGQMAAAAGKLLGRRAQPHVGPTRLMRRIRERVPILDVGKNILSLFESVKRSEVRARAERDMIHSSALQCTFKSSLLPWCIADSPAGLTAALVDRSTSDAVRHGACPGSDPAEGRKCVRCMEVENDMARDLARRTAIEMHSRL